MPLPIRPSSSAKAESGSSSIPEVPVIDREAAAYWIQLEPVIGLAEGETR
jgi:hypothetical protein